MRIRYRHPWDVTPAEAKAIQEKLRGRVSLRDERPRLSRVAGVDVGFEKGGKRTRAAIAVLALPALELQSSAVALAPTTFPYVPGLLSFREVPAILSALEKLSPLPHVLLCDGQGIAHPRRFGLACHLGLITGIPAVGVAKTRLVGTYGRVPDRRGAWTPLKDGDETIGAVLRTRTGVNPIFVSPGHRITLDTAVELVMRCVTRYRLPETTRAAHRLASNV